MIRKGHNKMKKFEKVILTDCDGVLLNWEYAFYIWMEQHGHHLKDNTDLTYDIANKYDLPMEEKKHLVRMFNQSASIGFLPPLRDAMHYVKEIHQKLGYTFHVITSLTTNEHAQKLRIRNLQKLFGETVFSKFIFLDTGEDKDRIFKDTIYQDSGYIWIEDKYENAVCGDKYGLNSCLMEHGHNMHVKEFPLFKNWQEIYESLK